MLEIWLRSRDALALPPSVALGVPALVEGYVPLLRRMASAPVTVVHGDYRLDNLFFDAAAGAGREVAVIDWHSRYVLSWRLSNSLESSFCIEALEEAMARHGKPEIFNTDQGSQFTSEAFTRVLIENDIQISMDGKGAWRDNVFVERLWKSVKYEEVYLRAYDSVAQARASLGKYFDFYNRGRPHSSLDRRTPDEAYFNRPALRAAA